MSSTMIMANMIVTAVMADTKVTMVMIVMMAMTVMIYISLITNPLGTVMIHIVYSTMIHTSYLTISSIRTLIQCILHKYLLLHILLNHICLLHIRPPHIHNLVENLLNTIFMTIPLEFVVMTHTVLFMTLSELACVSQLKKLVPKEDQDAYGKSNQSLELKNVFQKLNSYIKLHNLLKQRGKKNFAINIRYGATGARGNLPYGPWGPAVVGYGNPSPSTTLGVIGQKAYKQKSPKKKYGGYGGAGGYGKSGEPPR